MGEMDFAQSQTNQACQETIKQFEQAADEALRVKTLGGVFEVQWNMGGQIHRHGATGFLCGIFGGQWAT